MKITSLQNEKVKYWVNLKNNKKFREKEQKFIIEGEHLINEAKKNNLIEYTISMVDETADYYVTPEVMAKISDQKSVSYNAAVVSFLKEDSINGNIIILDNIQDPGNLGTIIRSAVAFNFNTIILSNDSVDLYNPKVIRATEGMIFNLNILRRDLKEFIPVLKNIGYQVVGTSVSKGSDIRSINKDNKAFVIGNEGSGIKSDILALCDELVTIKMNAACESLNAGIASSIIMYEVYHE